MRSPVNRLYNSDRSPLIDEVNLESLDMSENLAEFGESGSRRMDCGWFVRIFLVKSDCEIDILFSYSELFN